MKLGVCYYPEHWPESWWPDDAQRMREIGIRVVRLAEFAWSQIEPDPGRFDWAWLDRAVEVLHAAGLQLVMCTPTAAPPKWLIDAHPDVLAVDAMGNTRHFGSRRHYCFSSETYRQHARRITDAIGARYGQHPAVVAWQTDNEYGCHDTVISHSPSARLAFRGWLQQKHADIESLNSAWGCAFWSQRYRSFDEIDPPVSTVTEANPSHRLDWRRFSSDQVRAFNVEQVQLLRGHSPGRDITHNFMGFFTEFDHHDVSLDLDVASWDSYPLGFTQMFFLSPNEKIKWAKTGHPDIASFHHDLYRGMCNGRLWVMEQQPGPVNWAHWNPSPRAGMVRLWTWQAFAHGAELVSYFRWRQAPFGQEQMHAGLQRPDRSDDVGAKEASQVHEELARLAAHIAATKGVKKRSVALIFDYASIWMVQTTPHGADANALESTFQAYSALRKMGLDVDIVNPKAALEGYRLVVLPAQLRSDAGLAQRLRACQAQVVFGPRAGSKTDDFQIPANLAPGEYADLIGASVVRVSSLAPGCEEFVSGDGWTVRCERWQEDLQLQGAQAVASYGDGSPALTRHRNCWYLAGGVADAGWCEVLKHASKVAGLAVENLPDGLRVTRCNGMTFAFNVSDAHHQWSPAGCCEIVLGSALIAPYDLAIWMDDAADD